MLLSSTPRHTCMKLLSPSEMSSKKKKSSSAPFSPRIAMGTYHFIPLFICLRLILVQSTSFLTQPLSLGRAKIREARCLFSQLQPLICRRTLSLIFSKWICPLQSEINLGASLNASMVILGGTSRLIPMTTADFLPESLAFLKKLRWQNLSVWPVPLVPTVRHWPSTWLQIS